MLSSDGCQANKQGCQAATAMIVFECLWCAIETVAIGFTTREYKRRQEDEECRKEVWIRGYQVLGTYSHRCGFRLSFVHNALTSFGHRSSLLLRLQWLHYFRLCPQEYLSQKACAQDFVVYC